MPGKNRPFPDTSKWKPRKDAQKTLKTSFLRRCEALETRIKLQVEYEKQMNIDNFDAGPGIEDILREEFRNILPQRYSIRSGVLNDRKGYTGGDFDLIIFNDFWFPVIKPGATKSSRRVHLPIDGTYAVCEIKQSLDERILDQALEKLVICHRLHRPQTFCFRLTENRDGDPCIHGLTNPLYSAIIASDIKDGVDFDSLVERFFFINQSLERLSVVRALCILGHGTVTWGYKDENIKQVKPARFFRDDLYFPIIPIYQRVGKPGVGPALYTFLIDLMLHLYDSILAPEDIVAHYGATDLGISVPLSEDIQISPDKEWLEKLSETCRTKDHSTLLHGENPK